MFSRRFVAQSCSVLTAARCYTTLPQLTKPAGKPAELPTLSFDYKEGCKPLFSARQMELHYTKHHKAYVDKLNTLAGTTYDGKSIEDIIRATEGKTSDKVLYNQAAQHFNHTFFWHCLTPNGAAIPADLEKAIASDFKSIDEFKKAFEASGVNNFGSGWTWLCVDTTTKKLVIENTGNAVCPITGNLRPIFTADVWEHAYYKDFENRRPDYLKELWAVVNWEFVAKMYKQAMQ